MKPNPCTQVNDRLVNVVAQLERGTSMRLSKVSMMRFYLVPVICSSPDAFRSLVYDVSRRGHPACCVSHLGRCVQE
jgi:hypothetical protein